MAEKLAAVTGASSGIGYNLAKVFAEQGFDLVIGSAGERLDQAAEDLRALGVEVIEAQADLATPEGCDEFWRAVEGTGRRLDAVAINAGVGVGGLFYETDLKKELNIVRLNCESTVHIAKHAVKKMMGQGEGRILITSSIAGEMVAPREAVYAASKAFDLSFGKSLRAELQHVDAGVTVTVLQPGPTDTDFFHRAGMDNTQAGTEGKKDSDPYDVAKQGFEALMKGEEHVYSASWKVKMEGAMANVVPDKIEAAMHEKQAKPLNEK
jgi:short-subunit dehydrogenase